MSCTYITGQEKKIVPFAQHVACTVEMANLDNPVDVAVVDEIHLIGARSSCREKISTLGISMQKK